MAKNIYLLYEADAWLSYDSMVLMGVFDNDEALLDAVRALARKELENNVNHFRSFDEDDEEDDRPESLTEEERDEIVESVIDEFTSNSLQTQTYETNYYATETELNHLDEDGIR